MYIHNKTNNTTNTNNINNTNNITAVSGAWNGVLLASTTVARQRLILCLFVLCFINIYIYIYYGLLFIYMYLSAGVSWGLNYFVDNPIAF